MNPMAARRAELYQHLAGVVEAAVREIGIAPDLAEHVGAIAVDAIAEDVGGEVLSFPKDSAYKLSQRELAILDEHRHGATFAELARRYNMGERGIRKLVKRAELRHPTMNQQELFGT